MMSLSAEISACRGDKETFEAQILLGNFCLILEKLSSSMQGFRCLDTRVEGFSGFDEHGHIF